MDQEIEFIKKCIEVDEYWGDKMPMIACEEAGEFIQAISKHERTKNNGCYNPYTKSELIKEIGDMYISLMAIMNHYNIAMIKVEDAVLDKFSRKCHFAKS